MCKQLVNVSHHFTVTLFILYMHRCHSRTMECLEIIIIMSYTLCQFPPLSLDDFLGHLSCVSLFNMEIIACDS